MVYLAELLAVTTDRLIARIRCRNVPLIHGHKRLDDDASLASNYRKATVSRFR